MQNTYFYIISVGIFKKLYFTKVIAILSWVRTLNLWRPHTTRVFFEQWLWKLVFYCSQE